MNRRRLSGGQLGRAIQRVTTGRAKQFLPQQRPAVGRHTSGRDSDQIRDWSDYLVAMAAMVVGWALMAWPWLSGRVTIPWDAKAQFLPQIQFLAQSIARADSPFWNPYVFGGMAQIADPQSMIFSPPYLLLALVNGSPSAWAVDVTTLLAQLVGSFALMVWCADRGWHWAGALIGGLVFCFGASMAWRLQHTGQVLSLAYWPMALLCLDRAMDRRSYVYGAALGVVMACLILGRDQVALICAYLLLAYGVYRLVCGPAFWPMLRGVAMPIGLGGLVCVAIAALPLVMTALLAADSNRPSIDLEGAGRGSLHPGLLLTFLMPHVFGAAGRMEDYWGPPSFAWSDTGLYIAQNMGQVYIGILPVLLILIALIRGQLYDREIRFFTAATVVILLYALGWYTPAFRLMYDLLPGVNLYRRPADATFVIGALGAVLAAYATHRLFERPWEKIGEDAIVLILAVIAASVVTTLALGLHLDRVGRLGQPLAIAAICLIASTMALRYAKTRIAFSPRTAGLALAAVLAADLGWNNGPSTSSALPPNTYEAMNPGTTNGAVQRLKALTAATQSDTRRDRIELLGLGFHWPNLSMGQGLENTLGYNPVRSRIYSQATGAGDHIVTPADRRFSALLPSYRSGLVDLLGLRYIAVGAPLETIDKSIKPGDFWLNSQFDGVWIYENPRALPRVLFPKAARALDADALIAAGPWPDFDPTKTVLLDRAVSAVRTSLGAAITAPHTVRIITYRNTEVTIETVSGSGGWVVLNDVYHPWWAASIDGQATPLLRANGIFRAVEVPSGRHTIRFQFRPIQGALTQLRRSSVSK
jgi:energy-converting hydrogenase Eha subunit A